MTKRTAFSALDLDAIEKTADIASYKNAPKSSQITKSVARKTIRGVRVTVDAADTKVFSENPRLLEGDQDISELARLVRTTGTNNTPVEARKLDDGTIEVISGSRRRQACIKAGVPLTVDLYENVSDSTARLLTYMENSERKNISTLADCMFLSAIYEKNRLFDDNYSIEDLGSEYGISKSLAYDKVAIGSLAAVFRDSIPAFESWTLSKSIAMKKYVNVLRKKGVTDEDIKAVISNSETPQAAIASLISEISKEGIVNKGVAIQPRSHVIGSTKIKVTSTSKSSFSINVRGVTDQAIIEKFESLLKDLEGGNISD